MRRPLLLVLAACAALGGGRAHYGGTLQVCLVTRGTTADALLVNSPTDAAGLALTRTPLCRLVQTARPTPTTLRLTLPETLAPGPVVALLQRLQRSPSPLSAMLEGVTRIAPAGHAVELVNAPVDLERALCHPAFSVPVGPFRAGGKGLVAPHSEAERFDQPPSPQAARAGSPPAAQPRSARAESRGAAVDCARDERNPLDPCAQLLAAVDELLEGRPYVDQVSVTLTDGRAAERLLAQGRAHVGLGLGQANDVPQLFVLSLVFGPGLAPHLRATLEATIDRTDLVRFFVRPPSAPMVGLLPESLAGITPAAGGRTPRPAPLTVPSEVTLWFDVAAEDERAIAERLQLKLRPLGYRVALKGVPREELHSRPPRERELQLTTTLLPPAPAAATAVMLALAGERGRIAQLQAALVGLANPLEVDSAARQFAQAVLPELALWPLATRGLGVTTSADVRHLTRDPLGLPRLDDVFLSAE